MIKIQKRYYVLIVIAVLVFYIMLRDISPTSSFEIIKNSAVTEAVTEDSTLININTAGISELSTLRGIGEKTAQKIIDYRETHGAFEVIEDIMKIPGVGNGKFDEIKENIRVK